MDIKDYSQRYKDVRQDYRDQLQRVQEDYKKNLDNIEQNHETQREEQKDTYVSSLDEMAKKHETSLKEAGTNFHESSKASKRKFSKTIQAEKDGFAQERINTKNKFDTRISNLENAFRKNAQENSKRYETDIEYLDKYFNEVSAKRKDKFDDAQSSFRRNLEKSVSEMNVENRKEIQKLNQESESLRNRDLSSFKKDKLNYQNLAREDYLRLRDDSDMTKARMERQHGKAMTNLSNVKDRERDDVIENFQTNISELNRKNMHNEQKTIRAFNAQRRDTARLHTKDSDRLRREMGEVREQQEGENFTSLMRKDVKKNQERNIARLRTTLENRDIRHERDKEDIRNNFSDSLMDTKREYRKEVEGQVENANTNYAKILQKKHEQHDAKLDLFEDKIKTQDEKYWQDTFNIRRKGEERLTMRSENYAESVRRMNQDKAESLEDLKRIQSKEKKDYVTTQRFENFENIEEMRDGLMRDFQKTSEKYEGLVEFKDNKIQRLEEKYEESMRNLKNQFAQEIGLVRKDAEFRRIEEKRSARRAIFQAEVENSERMKNLRDQVAKRLNNAATEHQLQKERLVKGYENKIKEIKKAMNGEFNVKNSKIKNQMTSQKLAFTQKLESQKDYYENKIEELESRFKILRERDNSIT